MKLLVIGLGSMGKRRIRLLKEYDSSIEIIGIDKQAIRRDEVEKLYKIKTCDNMDEINFSEINGVLLCSSPLTHTKLILELNLKGIYNIFTELNLNSNFYDQIINMEEENKGILFLSSTLLYRKEIQYIKNILLLDKAKKTYNYHVGQYLPDWHPWENYNDFFIGKKETNGCREIMAIEFPWIVDIFGEIESFYCLKDKITDLNIDYNDNYHIILKHKNGTIGSLQFDVVSREATTSLEIISENNHIKWNGTPEGFKVFDLNDKKMKDIGTYEKIDRKEGYSQLIIEDMYLEEISTFINSIKEDKNYSKYSFKKDKEILSLIDKIEGE
ncbi:Gfo/Idh/MocA family oxidoreductase [Fusobacterium polymorphum]|uniref:Oxidoreductase n=1 Tax=Fusobacterium nucleatum subsp. polymorphum TaxID=76857 RepID=A0A2C6C972_FUSNP|nr:Gfo/Idh/MocA family oxidoreductase [Fusobacterium polymorphum]PHI12612.1 oxidoreductase [Fusobacterium polymorphum]